MGKPKTKASNERSPLRDCSTPADRIAMVLKEERELARAQMADEFINALNELNLDPVLKDWVSVKIKLLISEA